jgi:murein DD-endopeptidase MepM/ murein hydrolase activator NlpD
LLTSSSRALKQYPRRVTAVLATLMLGGGGGAFAVVSFGPDASDLPVQMVQQTVQALPAYEPFSDLNIAQFRLFRSELTRSNDTANTLLQRLGVDDTVAAAFMRNNDTARQLLSGASGRSVTAETNDNNTLHKLTGRWSSDTEGQFNRLVIEQTPDGFIARMESAPLTASTRLASGTIQSSLFASTDEANIPDVIASQVAEIFSGDIDFRRDLRKGDRYSIVYETLEGDGEPLRSGRVLSTEFVNNGKNFEAMWFQEPVPAGVRASAVATAKGGYYTLDGQSLRRAFLASPLAFSRVSSGFGQRFHPILKNQRAHLGVDFAAPTGTPIRGASDAVVDFAGKQNGYGNVVFLKHRNNITTVYAHMSRINVRKGQHIDQGDVIGLVGSTGWATGPHLHYEFIKNGVHQDPLLMARDSNSLPVQAAARPAFNRLAAESRLALNAAASLVKTNAQ